MFNTSPVGDGWTLLFERTDSRDTPSSSATDCNSVVDRATVAQVSTFTDLLSPPPGDCSLPAAISRTVALDS